MALRDQDRGQQMYNDAPTAESDWDKVSVPRSGGSASPKRDMIALRAPPSETSPKAEQPAAERPVETPDRPAEPAEKTDRPAKPAEKEAQPGDQQASKEKKPDEKPRKNFLRRHPLIAGVGLVALLVAGVAAYVY
jgi:hypothetical protein